MSDDTPTQRFDAPLTPTTPLTTSPSTPPTPPVEPTPEERRRRLIAVFIALSAVLLAALIVVLIVLFTRGGTPAAIVTPTDAASAYQSATPSATPTPTPTPAKTTGPTQPPSSGPTLTSFTSSTDVQCNAAKNPIPLDFSWVGTGAAAYFAVGSTNDPKSNGQGWTLPPTGSQADFPAGQDILYPCTQATATFTIGVYDNSGHKVVRQLVVTNHGTVG